VIKIGLYLSRIQKVYRENTLFRRFDDFDPRADRAQRICKFQSLHYRRENTTYMNQLDQYSSLGQARGESGLEDLMI